MGYYGSCVAVGVMFRPDIDFDAMSAVVNDMGVGLR